jgi:TetR/AcrR family transcriptional regulator, mexJK operon transcriptional repressor
MDIYQSVWYGNNEIAGPSRQRARSAVRRMTMMTEERDSETLRGGRPKDPAKRAALVAAAQELFMERGFEATSIDAIAAQAGVAKVTVYSHFSGKDALFAAAVTAKCDFMLGADLTHLPGETVEARLMAFARRFLGLITDPDSMAVHRLVMAEGGRHPEIADIFFTNAVMGTCARLGGMLQAEVAAGALSITDYEMAAGQFLALIKGMPMLRQELHIAPMSPEETERHLAAAVATFLKAYRA